jgi:prepilin-type N-terminal cleavage/methylation domain-containing protein
MNRRPTQGGFSLIELMIAMVVTLIVSGAVYGLLTSGQNAFRREPELIDRQQNIRAAMDLMQRDIGMAGMELPAFMQVFTHTDATTGQPLNGMGPMGPFAVNADELEVFGNDGTCPTLEVCGDQGVNVFTVEYLPACYRFPSLVLLYNENCQVPCPASDPDCAACYTFGFAKLPGHGGGSGGCNANGHVNFPHGQAPIWNPPGGKEPVTAMGQIGVFRWWIQNDAAGTPNLWRSTVGKDPATSLYLSNNGADVAPQLVARGIEDLQVRYTMANGVTADAPADRDPNNDATAVTQVRVTLTARTETGNLQGASQPTGAARPAVRGQLTTITSPRTALTNLATGTGQLWR